MTATATVDLLDPGFFGARARAVYRELRPTAPVVRDERNRVWGVLTWQGVRTVGGNPAIFSSALGTRVESGPVPWMMDRDPPDHTKRRTVKMGETLALIAHEEYDDPAEWRRIADANGIEDPLNLTPGTRLLVPPILK